MCLEASNVNFCRFSLKPLYQNLPWNTLLNGHVSQGGTIYVISVISKGCMAIACINHTILYITGKLIFLSVNLCCQMWSVLQNKYVSQLEPLKNRRFLHVPCYVRVKKIIIKVTLLGNGRRYFDPVFFHRHASSLLNVRMLERSF